MALLLWTRSARILSAFLMLIVPCIAFAETENVIDVSTPSEASVISPIPAGVPSVELFPLVRSGTFTEEGLFEVPIAINTHGSSVNTIELSISFDPTILNIVKPSGGNSIVNLWLETPTYSNASGDVHLTGFIRNGITTSSGVITTLTFKAVRPGETTLIIEEGSRVLRNDGYGTQAPMETVRGNYTILPKPPGAVRVYSETHPVSGRWYANNNPIFSWDTDPANSGYSYELDDKPNTVPDNEPDTETTAVSFQEVPDGISYFHLKPRKKGRWGETTHYQIRIDTAPPAEFVPVVAKLRGTDINQTQLTFFTTDELSGFDHFEIGISDARRPDERPIFVQAESPYVFAGSDHSRVVVRAFDAAGNVRDITARLSGVSDFLAWLKDGMFFFMLAGCMSLLLFLFMHYAAAHHLVQGGQHAASKIEQIMRIITRKDP